MFSSKGKSIKPIPSEALLGRNQLMQVTTNHFVTGNTIVPPFPTHLEQIIFGLGCFWGAERKFWQQSGIFSTAVGYLGGDTANPTYDEVCTGLTGHNEVIRVIFDPKTIPFEQLLIIFWESHNPTQGMRQGNDKGTQYRSGIYTLSDTQQSLAIQSKQHYQKKLSIQGQNTITTEIHPATEFYYAEDYHQQYLAKNPQGYCGLGGLNIVY